MAGQVVNVREARARLSQLMEEVAASDEVVSISRSWPNGARYHPSPVRADGS